MLELIKKIHWNIEQNKTMKRNLILINYIRNLINEIKE